MRMKKTRLVMAIILVCLFAAQVLVYAAPDSSTATIQNEKKKVALIIANDRDSLILQKKEVEPLWVNPISQKLSERYNVSIDQKYYEKFKAAGYPNITEAERSDIIDILKDDNLDYAILIEFLRVDVHGRYTFHAEMKIIDIKANKNIYSGKFAHSSGGNVKPLADQMIAVINEKLM
jgi:hypothetical protein